MKGAEVAERKLRFIRALTHTKGKFAGCKFELIPWQEQLLRKLFGTLTRDGLRQYRTCFLEIPKKNGKSELGAAIGLNMLIADGEEGAEVYSAAADRGQAALIYHVAKAMVRANHTLSKRLKVIDSIKRIVDYKTNSFYQVLSSEAFTKHGLSPSCVLFDELHAQPTRELWDVLTEGTDYARTQQLIFVMTTAGLFDAHAIGWEVHEYARQVRDGVIEDKSFLPVMYGATDKDDWRNEKVWKRCNPSLGHIFELDKIRRDYQGAVNNPAKAHNFKRYRLNLWVTNISKYLPMEAWDACDGKVQKSRLLKHACWGGLDLSSKIDLTAFVLVFPDDEKKTYSVLPHFYMPAENIEERERTDRIPYRMWIEAGLLTATPGNVVDYAYIKRDVINASRIFELREVAFDPWGAQKLAPELQDEHGIVMVEHRQGLKSMSEPTKELHAAVISGKLRHGGHPVLRWNADNLEVKIDESENVRPVKGKSRQRIDGMVALIMALGRALQGAGAGTEIPDDYEVAGA